MNQFNEIKNWHNEVILKEVKDNLTKRDFNVVILNTINDIADYMVKTIPANARVGLGGSITLREIGIDKLLRDRGNTLLDHWEKNLTPEQSLETRKGQLTSDYFLTSANAVTRDGRIINIDGIGNRVAAMIFGPKHVIAVISANKIAKDLDDAIYRAKNTASAMNTKRGNMETPCAKTGFCADCRPPKTICRVTTIIDYRPMLTDFTVILTPVELGF
ncbi:MAG: lactate utilization protein [Spirochaetota bacterium]